jgi:S1-C subfamily serine protease
MATLTPEVAAENNSDPNAPFEVPEINGILVVRVLPNTPAAASGMRRGDVIVQIDGQAVETAAELQRIVDSSGIGQMLEMKVQRGKQTTSIGIRTGELQEQS